ncbi:MAG: carboxy terminal-processing peptidase [Phycisphaerales bacterium]|nr:carboxy terminal-processing peptidase [Phycisphaerales bacterium]
MNSKKGLAITFFLVFSLLIVGLSSHCYSHKQSPPVTEDLLPSLTEILETNHYEPKPIGTELAKTLESMFFDNADHEKSFLLQQDIDTLMTYQAEIVAEMKNKAPNLFVSKFMKIYNQRFDTVNGMINNILATPFHFDNDDIANQESSKLQYAHSLPELKQRWYKQLKYFTLQRYLDRYLEKNPKISTDSLKIFNDTLEKDARAKVVKIMKRYMDKLKFKNTYKDWNATYLNSLCGSMDPHTDYFPPIEKRAFDEELSGRFYGIGARLQEVDEGVKIVSIIAGGPAWKQGNIKPGDIITRVISNTKSQPVDIAGFPVDEIVKLIRGNKGTTVTLTLKTPAGVYTTLSLVRDEIVVDEIYARSAIIEKGNKKIGYIYLPEFYAPFDEGKGGNKCSEDVANEVHKLKDEHVSGIILDLRSNGGGSLYEVVKMVGLFTGKGPVVQVRNRNDDAKHATVLNNDENDQIYDGPLVVLVNEFSASASEIFAGAIQDYKRGLVVGSTSTFGKGTVQKSIPLGDNNSETQQPQYGALKITFQKFYRIDGGSTQLKGVHADVVIPDRYEYLKLRERDLPNALHWDKIAKTDYNTTSDANRLNKISTEAQTRILKDELLKKIDTDAKILTNKNNEGVSLNIVQYHEFNNSVRKLSADLDSISKLSTNNLMHITVAAADTNKYYHNIDTLKGQNYIQWLKAISSDLYIDESSKIVEQLATKQ